MKNFLLALMVVLTTCTLAGAQNQNPVAHDSISQAESTLVVDTDTTDSIAKENVTTTDTSNHSVLYSLSNAMEDVLIPIIAIISGLYVLLNQLFMAGPDARKVAVGGIILVLIGLPVRAIFTQKKAA